MDLEIIKELSNEGEEEYNVDLNDSLEVPQGEIETEKTFKREDVLKCFEKPFAISESIYLVGSTCTYPDGNAHDVDIVITSDIPEDLQKATKFRLYRAFSDYFDIPYDETPNYLQIESKEGGSSAFTDYSSLYKFGLIPTPNEERTIRKMSVDNEKDNDNFEILEKSKRRIIGGLATTSMIDRQNEEISPQALKKIWQHIEKIPDEFLNLMIEHESSQIGILLREHKNHRMALLNKGIYIIAEIRQDIPLADKIWKSILSKELHSFSIKINIPKPFKKNIEEICDDERCWTRINDAKFLEVSLVSNPANPECEKLDILSKENY